MRKLYVAFPICETLSHKLSWSHYFELLKCDNPLEMLFYFKQAIKEVWKERELKRQIKSLYSNVGYLLIVTAVYFVNVIVIECVRNTNFLHAREIGI